MSVAGADVSTYWYEMIENGTIRQGDIFFDLVCVWPKEDLPEVDVHDAQVDVVIDKGTYIIASASCDVDQVGYPFVLLNRILPANEQTLKATGKDYATKLEVLRQGLVPSQYLLPASDAVYPELPMSVVHYKMHALMPLAYLRRNASKPRLRLRHPHRERFGNWVGSCISRVGPETNELIPKQGSMFPSHVLKANTD